MQVREERRREIVMRGQKGEEMDKDRKKSKKKREFSISRLEMRVANFFYRGLDKRHFELCGSYSLLLIAGSSHRQQINRRA